MSRTIKINGKGRGEFFRRPKTQRSRIIESIALEDLIENGFHGTPRLKNRANLAGCIPTAYDDLSYSTRGRHGKR